MCFQMAKYHHIIKKNSLLVLIIGLIIRGTMQVFTITMGIKPINPMITAGLHFVIILCGSIVWAYKIKEKTDTATSFWMGKGVAVSLVAIIFVSNSIYMWTLMTMEKSTYILSPEGTECLVIDEGENIIPDNHYAFVSKVVYKIFKKDLHYQLYFVDKLPRNIFRKGEYEIEWLNETDVIIQYPPKVDAKREEWRSLRINLDANE